MNIRISDKHLESTLMDLKDQSIYVDIQTSVKGWAGEYCMIEEVKHLPCAIGDVLILILKSEKTDEWKVFPLEVIEGIRLSRMYSHFDTLANEFTVDAENTLEPSLN